MATAVTSFGVSGHSIGSAVMQIGVGQLVKLPNNVPVMLGDLQPKREMVIHILTNSFSAYSVKRIREALIFSADELGRVKYKFPLPFHQRQRLQNLAGGLFFISSMLFGALLSAMFGGH